MLQLAVIRQQPDLVKQRLLVKHFDGSAAIHSILLLDEKRKKIQLELESAQAGLNAISKEIGQHMAKGEKAQAEEKKQQVVSIKSSLSPLQQALNEADEQLQAILVTLPNLPSEQVPPGKTPEENVVVREGGKKPVLPAGAVAHWDLAKKYNLIDFELGNKITGSGFPVYINKGAKLQRALIQYFLDYNTSVGFIEYQPPLVVNKESAFGTGQLPDKEGQMYYVSQDDLYLIPTSEVPLTNIFRDTILKEKELPIKMTAYTPCFRREAGSYGKDVRGLNRLHQFDKVEIVQIVRPADSYAALEELTANAEEVLRRLEIPYRTMALCGGDIGFGSAKTYDLEAWLPAQEKYREISSCSNFEAFQARRMQARWRNPDGGKPEPVHTLNGSGLAVGRTLVAVLENYQQADGSVEVPQVLRPYMGGKAVLTP
jgi:seryl-tRNA synthetase